MKRWERKEKRPQASRLGILGSEEREREARSESRSCKTGCTLILIRCFAVSATGAAERERETRGKQIETAAAASEQESKLH